MLVTPTLHVNQKFACDYFSNCSSCIMFS